MSHSLKDASVSMKRDFLLYWKPDSVDDNRAHRPLLRHAGSDELEGVSVGDTLWISTVRDGGLFVAGRLKVGECTDREGAKQRLGTDDGWEATFHVIAAPGTIELLRNMSMAPVVTEMRFQGANDRLVLRNGKIDPGQLEPMRELAPASAVLLTTLWTQYQAGGRGLKTPQRNGLRKNTGTNGDGHALSAERILESLGDELDLVADATRTPWIAYLNKEAYRLLKDSDPELFYTNEEHEYLRAWEDLTVPFIIHMRVEIDDRIPNSSPDYGCRREVDRNAEPTAVAQNIAAYLGQLSLKNPEDSQTHYNLGIALSDAGRPKEAIQAYRRALTAYPGMIGAHYNLGSTYLAIGEHQLAIEQLDETTRLAPGFAQAYFTLGTALMALGSHSVGIEAMKRGLESSPDDLGAHFNISRAFKELKDYEAAILWLEKAVRVSPSSADAYYEMGRIYQRLEKYEDEFSSYFEAVELRKDYIQALFALGVAYARLKRGSESRVVSKEPPRDLDVQDSETFYYVALAYLALGDLHLARKWRNSLREIDPPLADELEPYITEREDGTEPEVAQTEFEPQWSEADQNPFGIRVLDCTGFSANMLSTTADEKTAAAFLSLRESTGLEHRGHSPERVVRFQCRLKYSPLETPEEGALFTASQMEDKWDIYFHDGYLYFAQSWTGLLAYRAWAVFRDGGLVIDLVEADREDTPQDKTYATRAVDFLIKSHLLRGLVPHPIPGNIENDPEQIALFSFSNFGRWAKFASYENTLPCRAQEAFSPEGVQLVGLEGEAVLPNEAKGDDTVVVAVENPNLRSSLTDSIDMTVPEIVNESGLTFESEDASDPEGSELIAADQISDSVSVDSSDSGESAEAFDNPVEAVRQTDEAEISVTTAAGETTVEDKSDLVRAKEALAKAQRVFVLTGAGVSAESNVPTFRGPAGVPVWRGMPFEELSSARMVQDNLPLVWEWFDYRRGVVAECRPNAGHLALARCDLSGRFDEFTLVTQNVDGLHAAAGSTGIIELHGNIWRARCVTCHALRDTRSVPTDERPPVCVECGHLMRPDIVLFGENLPVGAFEKAYAYAKKCDVCLVIGTSALVTPAANLPEAALQAGKFVIEINPEVTAFSSRCNVSLRGLAGEILPQLLPSDGRELVLKVAADGGGVVIYRKKDERGAWKYSARDSSMDFDEAGEEGVNTRHDLGETLEEALTSVEMSDETLLLLYPVKIHPEYLWIVREIVDRIAGNASEQFKKDRWAQESLTRWREMTEPSASRQKAKGGTYTLRSGRTVSLAEVSLSHTYAGLLEGTLETASRLMRRDLSRKVAETMPPGAPLVIVDDTTTVLARFRWIAHFESSSGAQTDDLDYHSRLYVCWFTDDMSDQFNSLIGKVLSSIDWEANARDYDWTNV